MTTSPRADSSTAVRLGRANAFPVGLLGEAMMVPATSGEETAATIAFASREKSSRNTTACTVAPPITASGVTIEYPGAVTTTRRPVVYALTRAKIASFDPLDRKSVV